MHGVGRVVQLQVGRVHVGLPAGEVEDLRRPVAPGRRAVVVLREAVLGLRRLVSGVGRRRCIGSVALGHVQRQQRLQKLQRAPTVGDDMGHLHVNAPLVVGDAEEHAFGARVQIEADGQRLGLDAGRLRRGHEVVPEKPAAQTHVEAGEQRHGPVERSLKGGRVHLVGHGGGDAEDGLPGSAGLGGVELADVV